EQRIRNAWVGGSIPPFGFLLKPGPPPAGAARIEDSSAKTGAHLRHPSGAYPYPPEKCGVRHSDVTFLAGICHLNTKH
ncbi:MAG TPA: hypothetical protein PK529_03430, partial [Verrucomicrobiales bacterium]|nr:hypothetical protein [Verrucomicrobiales bacterium]